MSTKIQRNQAIMTTEKKNIMWKLHMTGNLVEISAWHRLRFFLFYNFNQMDKKREYKKIMTPFELEMSRNETVPTRNWYSDVIFIYYRSIYLLAGAASKARKKGLGLEASPRVLLGSLLTINRLIEVYRHRHFHDLITAFLSTWNFLTKS